MDKFKPDYYKTGGIDVIEFCQRQKLSYTIGNIIKYVVRAGRKDSEAALDDLKKAREYIDREIAFIEQNGIEGGLGRDWQWTFSTPANGTMQGSGGSGGVGGGFGVIGHGETNKEFAPVKAVPVENLDAGEMTRPRSMLEELWRRNTEEHIKLPGGAIDALEAASNNCPNAYDLEEESWMNCCGNCAACWTRPYEEVKHD